MFGEVRAALAIFELASEVREELLNELATELPQCAQLVEHERGIAAFLSTEPLLESRQHFLDALGSAFLLLDAVLEPVDLVLQLAVGFFQFRAIAEQRQNTIDPLRWICLPDEKAA